MNIKELQKIIDNEPLFERDICMRSIDESFTDKTTGNLFVGVGLCTAKKPATAIPFDILTFFLLPELLRRKGVIESTFFLIADTHALTNSFMSPLLVNKLATLMKQTALSIIRSFRLQQIQVVLASEIRKQQSFQILRNHLSHMDNQYVQEEIADLSWFMKTHNVRFKLGWSISNESTPSGHDERFFDMQIKQFLKTSIVFLHSSAGRTDDPKRPKTSPYIATDGEKRVVLSKNPISMMKTEMAIHHIKRIVRLFETLIVKIPFVSLEDKINFIIQTATQDVPAVV